MKEILEPACKKVIDARKERLDAIMEFNRKFGTYHKSYSGNDALKEFEKLYTDFSSMFLF